jgi:NAD(P)-dependent dehydrogenase (short-subunit alcohol dehydrogenase family)
MFLRAAQPAVDAGVDCGLVQISSASARIAYPGLAIYGAAKAAMEQWVRAVRAERDDRGKGPWVGAIRPGFVDTPAARRDAALPEDTYPGVAGIAEAVRTGNFLTADESAENIWNSIPDDVIAKPVLLFGEAVGVTT